MGNTRALITTLASIFTLFGSTPRAEACSAFALKRGKNLVVAKSYDWHNRDGLVMVNKRGVAKRALLLRAGAAKAASWVSRYGSVTFNQYGRELPLGGINEAGVVVEILWLRQTRYGRPDARRETVNELSLIQYLLDTAGSTEQALAAAKRLQIAKAYARVHYLVCDRQGACATLEYLGGKLEAHHGAQLRQGETPLPLLTNSTYRVSRRHLGQYQGFGGSRNVPKRGSRSLTRFVRAASLLKATPAEIERKGLRARAFSILGSVRIPNYSRWNIVYEPKQRTVAFRLVDGGKSKILRLKTQQFDYRCQSTVAVMDLTGAVTGKAGVWLPYQRKYNERLLRLGLRRLGNPLGASQIRGIAGYPERLRCAK